ncbi:unnamed protein product [Lampetra fluviatilis]
MFGLKSAPEYLLGLGKGRGHTGCRVITGTLPVIDSPSSGRVQRGIDDPVGCFASRLASLVPCQRRPRSAPPSFRTVPVSRPRPDQFAHWPLRPRVGNAAAVETTGHSSSRRRRSAEARYAAAISRRGS